MDGHTLPISWDEALVLAGKVARKMLPRTRFTQEFDDLRQEAMLALVKYGDRFDPSRRVPFAKWAQYLMTHRLLDYIRDQSPLSRNELAKIKRGEALPVRVTSIDEVVYEDNRQVRLEHLLSEVVDPTAGLELDEAVQKMFRRAGSAQGVAVLVLYYLEGMSMKEVACELGLSEARVSQVHSRAMALIKEASGVAA